MSNKLFYLYDDLLDLKIHIRWDYDKFFFQRWIDQSFSFFRQHPRRTLDPLQADYFIVSTTLKTLPFIHLDYTQLTTYIKNLPYLNKGPHIIFDLRDTPLSLFQHPHIYIFKTAFSSHTYRPLDLAFPQFPRYLLSHEDYLPINQRPIIASFQGSRRPSSETRNKLFELKEKDFVYLEVDTHKANDKSPQNIPESFEFELENNQMIIKRSEDPNSYLNLLRRSIFSICIRGTGYALSYRLIEAMSQGSIPVIISDDHPLPFGDRIPWDRCSITWKEKDILSLNTYLRNFTRDNPKKLEEMQDNVLLIYRQYFQNTETILEKALSIWEEKKFSREKKVITQKFALLTLNLNNRPFHKYTLNTMKKYAQKIGADLIIDRELTIDPKLRERNHLTPYIQKMKSIEKALDEYDRVLYLDDTIFIGDKVENLFQLVPASKLGGFSEMAANMLSYNFDRQFLLEKKGMSLVEYLNSGVLVISQGHRKIFQEEELIKELDLFKDKYPNQAYFNYQITKEKIEIYRLDQRFNYQPPFIHPDRLAQTLPPPVINQIKENPDRIYHLTGYYQHRHLIAKEIAPLFNKVTAVIMNFHRPENLKKIILPALLDFDLIDQIIISHCNEKTYFDLKSEKKEILHRRDYEYDKKYGLYTRFIVPIESSKNDVLLIMDDDLIFDSGAFNQLYRYFLDDPEILHGFAGRKLDEHDEYICRDFHGEVPIVITRGLLTHIDNLRYAESYRGEMESLVSQTQPKWNGEDIFLSLMTVHKNKRLNKAYPLPHRNLADNNPISRHQDHLNHRRRLTRNLVHKYQMKTK